MWKRFSEGSKPATASARTQPSLEAQAKEQQGTQEACLCLSRKDLCPPPPFEGSRRPDWDKKALLSEARGEEVEVREVLKAIRRAVRLENSHQNLRH